MATLIIEDGTGLNPDVNTYSDLADVKTYAADRGAILSSDDSDIIAQIILAMDWLEAKDCDFQGEQVQPGIQPLSWPRKDVYLNGSETMFPIDQLPKQLKSCVAQLVMSQAAGIDIFPNIQAADYVTEETVGPITTKYADPIKTGVTPYLSAVEKLLDPLTGECGQNVFLRTVRV